MLHASDCEILPPYFVFICNLCGGFGSQNNEVEKGYNDINRFVNKSSCFLVINLNCGQYSTCIGSIMSVGRRRIRGTFVNCVAMYKVQVCFIV